MNNKNVEISLGLLIIVVLIIILILGAFIYYILNNPNLSNSLDNSNSTIQDINVSNTNQITDTNTLNDPQDTNSYTNDYTQNTNSNFQTDITNTIINTNDTNSNESVSTPNVTNDLSSYKGVWRSDQVLDSGIPDEEFIINDITNNSINFDYIKYRIVSFNSVTAQLTNNIATFEVANNNINIKGTVTLSNNTIILTINSSSFESVKPGSYTFRAKAQNSVLK